MGTHNRLFNDYPDESGNSYSSHTFFLLFCPSSLPSPQITTTRLVGFCLNEHFHNEHFMFIWSSSSALHSTGTRTSSHSSALCASNVFIRSSVLCTSYTPNRTSHKCSLPTSTPCAPPDRSRLFVAGFKLFKWYVPVPVQSVVLITRE